MNTCLRTGGALQAGGVAFHDWFFDEKYPAALCAPAHQMLGPLKHKTPAEVRKAHHILSKTVHKPAVSPNEPWPLEKAECQRRSRQRSAAL
ncbi:MAG TPA: hypothetical protein VKX25_01865 [Bryobacteraceae bacterium]|jgi:hypothetical protein|nr:hypothetical protein [Bryobacteraceae bacterium]